MNIAVIEEVRSAQGVREVENADGVVIGPRRPLFVLNGRVFTSHDEALDILEAERAR